MPTVNSLGGMASILGLDYDQLIYGLIGVGILNQNGFPKKKLIDEGYFNSDGSIRDYPGLRQLIKIMLGLE